MPAVESQRLPLCTEAPPFTLPDPEGTLHTLRSDAPATLVMFISYLCRLVIHSRREPATIGTEYEARGVAIYAINSNDVITYPADNPQRMKEEVALDAVLASETPDETQIPGIGCSIKWITGNESEYA
jgi:hypothetical protein